MTEFTMTETMVFLLIKLGALSVLAAGIVLFRAERLSSRLNVSNKISLAGIGLLLMGVALYFDNPAMKFALAAFVGIALMANFVTEKA